MHLEVELKLRIAPAAARRLPAHPLLAGIAPQRRRLQNTYYDTPDLALRARGVALRHRRQGWTWLMTVKGGEPANGGLARRNEWEAPTNPGEFDFSIVTDAALRDFLERQRPRLAAVFTTDFTRLAWSVERDAATLELALDRGHIAAGDAPGARPLPLCELEIEQIAGPHLDSLFDLAIELAGDFHLHPDIASKAERGYQLFTGAAPAPVKAAASPLGAAMSPREAFRAIALDCLGQLQRNEAGVIAGEDPEFVHQARVAIRRLRSAQKLFAPQLPEAFVATYGPRWRALAASLGAARDWDVFVAETLPPLAAQFPDAPELAALRDGAERIRAQARHAARRALRDEDYSRLLLAYTAALFRLPEAGGERLRRFAHGRLRRRYRKLRTLAAGHATMSANERHALRIAFKQLRYAIEFFAPLLPRRRMLAWQAALADLQELLGRLNDLTTATRLITEAGKAREIALIRGWIGGRESLLVAALGPALRDFLAARVPWA